MFSWFITRCDLFQSSEEWSTTETNLLQPDLHFDASVVAYKISSFFSWKIIKNFKNVIKNWKIIKTRYFSYSCFGEYMPSKPLPTRGDLVSRLNHVWKVWCAESGRSLIFSYSFQFKNWSFLEKWRREAVKVSNEINLS